MTVTREQRIVAMFDRLNEMDPDKQARLVELAEASMAHRQLTVEQNRLHVIAISDPTKENVARYLDYTEDTVDPSKKALNALAYDLLKTGFADDVDAFRADMRDLFKEVREDFSELFGDVANRVTAGVTVVRSKALVGLGKLAARGLKS